MVLLLVTWIVNGQPPSSYQATFNSMNACEIALSEVRAEAARIEIQEENYAKQIHAIAPIFGPVVAAVCATQ
jgi:hypothetical protein